MKILFGPVSSRRFGRSLGIDLSPSKKQCNFDCVYCELDPKKAQEKQDEIISIDKIISEVKVMLEKNVEFDFLTLTANGEPSLYPYLNELILSLRSIAKDKKLLILSNGTVLTFMTDGNTENNIYTPDTLYITASFNGNKSIYNDESRDYARHDVMMVIPIKSNDTKVRFFTWQDNSSNFANVDRDKLKNQAKFGCNENIDKRLRWNCGALIQYDNWEIKDDYPWR